MESLSQKSTIKRILKQSNFKFTKALGQNFMINENICYNMAQVCEANENVGVIEIGPGIGALTKYLAEISSKVVAVEYDKRLIDILSSTLKDYDNIKIINDDILNIDLKKLIFNEFDNKEIVVCANLPYNITSPIIMLLLKSKLPIKCITFMVQKETARRICAKPGTRQVGAISIVVWYYTKSELLFEVDRSNFMPVPNVDSQVIKLEIRKEPPVKLHSEQVFFNVVKASFSQRRKTILNSVSSKFNITKDELTKIFEEAKINPMLRAEQLTLEQFALISNLICKGEKNES